MRFCAIPRAVSFFTLFLGSGLLIGCGGGRMSAPKLKEILVAPTNPPIARGTSVQLSATGLFDDGITRPLDVAPIWQTSRSSVVSVDTQGNVTGLAEGVAQVSAVSQGITGSTTVTVGAAALVSITVTPAQPALALGESLQLTATGNFSDGTTQDLTQIATWTLSGPGIASVTSTGGTVANAIGTATITATAGTIVGSTSLTVGPAAVLSLNIVPPTLALSLGSSHPIQAIAGMSDGTAQDVTAAVTWSSSPATVATVNQGSVIAVGKGSSLLSASYQHATASAAVSVGPPGLLSIAVGLNQPWLPLGEAEQLTATGKYSDGSVQNLTQSATWSASGSAATVNTAGSVTANAVGATTISATSSSITGSASLTVTPAVATALNIVPAALTLSLGTNGPLHAIATMSDGTTQDMTTKATWSSTQAAIATVSQGNVSSMAKGFAQVSAAYQGLTGSSSITVGPPALVSIAVSPNQSSIPLGETGQLVASGTYTDGSVQNVSQSVTWTSAAAAIASVSASGSVAGKGTGTTTISASLGSITGSASLTVSGAVATALNIAPAALTLSLGTKGPLRAIATMSDGTTQDMTTTATWSSTQAAVATVAQGNVSSVAKGSAQVSAAYQKLTGISSITVGPPALVSITVSPNQSSLPLGETEQLIANGTYTDGSVQNLTQSATWTSNTATIATVTAGGSVVGKGTGTTTISATSASIVGSASVKVASPVVVSVNITPATLAMIVNSNRPLLATATFSDGTTQNVTTTAAWGTMPANIATISNAGIASAMQVGSTTVAAQFGGVTGSAALTVMPLALVSYFNHAAVIQSGVDGTVQIVNPGLDPGNLCAMVYVFDQNQELNECCGCTISGDGMRTLSVANDLTANPLTGIKPNVGEVRIVPSDPAQNPQCDPAHLAPAGALAAWSANPQVKGGGAQVTESQFRTVTLTNNEQGFLANMCSYLEKLGSGKGICSCGTGD